MEARRAAPGIERCPVTNVTVPECGCRACNLRLLKTHAPWVIRQADYDDAIRDPQVRDVLHEADRATRETRVL